MEDVLNSFLNPYTDSIINIIESITGLIFFVPLTYILITDCIKGIYICVKHMHLNLRYENDIERWKTNNYNLIDIYSLTDMEFVYWCGEIFKKCGFEISYINNDDGDNYKDIICCNGQNIIYVMCRKYLYTNNSNTIVNCTLCRKLLGKMTLLNIKNGIILTTGNISKDALKYIDSIPGDMFIKLLDGKSLF